MALSIAYLHRLGRFHSDGRCILYASDKVRHRRRTPIGIVTRAVRPRARAKTPGAATRAACRWDRGGL